MNKKQLSREALLKEMGQINQMEYGELGEFYKTKVIDGATVKVGPYYRRQVWRDGGNVTEYVPMDKLQQVREAISGRQRFEELAGRFIELTVAATRQGQDQDSKKNSTKRPVKSGMSRRKAS